MEAPSETPRQRGRPARLTHDQIVSTALRVVETDGLNALSMRRLGRELDVSPMAPYGYFDSKTSLIRAMLDAVAQGLVPEENSGAHWSEQLSSMARKMRLTILEHPRLAQLFVTAPALGGRAMAAVEAMIGTLRAQGVPGDSAVRAVYAVTAYSIGFVAQEVARDERSDAARRRERLRSLPVDRFPNLVELADPASGYASDEQFESGLAALVAGYRAQLD